MAKYTEAIEVADIAQELISKHHEHLVNARIAYIFRDKAGTRGGKEVWGSASKMSVKNKMLSGYDFVIEIAQNIWDRITPDQQLALVDHELSHCGMDEKGGYITHEHDFEGFNMVLGRHGHWTGDLQRMNKVSKQLEFDIPKEESEEEKQAEIVSAVN